MMYSQIAALRARRSGLVVLALGLGSTLAGCSGSGEMPNAVAASQTGQNGSGSNPALPTANSNTGGGLWWGVLATDGQADHSAMCLLVESGELACVLKDTTNEHALIGAVHGTVKISSTTAASGSGKFYATPGNVLADGTSVVADFTVTGGSLKEGNSLIELTFTSLGVDSVFSGYYDHYYATSGAAFLWPADGVYTTFDIYGDAASLSIDRDGSLFLQTASGCAGAGTMINIDPGHVRGAGGYNAYTVDLTMSNCAGLDGDYEGLSTLIDFAWVNGTDNLVIAVFTDTIAIVGEAVK